MHLEAGVLVAYRDRELNEEAGRNVARHLESCPKCAHEEKRLSSDWELLLAADARFRSQCVPPAGGLDRVLSGIEEWKRSAAASPAAQSSNLAEVRRRIGAHLELYFGSGTAAMLERTAASPRPVAAVEPLLTAFLGRKAAAAVVGQILDGIDRGFHLTAEAV